jgi:hypothetical protein
MTRSRIRAHAVARDVRSWASWREYVARNYSFPNDYGRNDKWAALAILALGSAPLWFGLFLVLCKPR